MPPTELFYAFQIITANVVGTDECVIVKRPKIIEGGKCQNEFNIGQLVNEIEVLKAIQQHNAHLNASNKNDENEGDVQPKNSHIIRMLAQ